MSSMQQVKSEFDVQRDCSGDAIRTERTPDCPNRQSCVAVTLRAQLDAHVLAVQKWVSIMLAVYGAAQLLGSRKIVLGG